MKSVYTPPMKLPDMPLLEARLTSRDIRAVAARLAHPEDPQAEWRFEFGEWRQACAEFQEMEQDEIVALDVPPPTSLRQHRYLLFLLMAHGEELALNLLRSQVVTDPEKTQLLEQVDAFIGTLGDSWHTWHGEALPAHRDALAGFLG
jgi:hypothetical protein